MRLAYWNVPHYMMGNEHVPQGGVRSGTSFLPSRSLCVSHGTSNLMLLKDFSRAVLTFGSNADFRPGPLFRSNHFSLGPSWRPLGPRPQYWLHGDWFLLHFWKSSILLEFSGVHVLTHLCNKHFLSSCIVSRGASSSGDAKVCSWDHGAEGLPRLPVKRLQVPGNMTKGICLARNRALETGIKTFSLVMCVVVLEN